jgi:hypothetical protein
MENDGIDPRLRLRPNRNDRLASTSALRIAMWASVISFVVLSALAMPQFTREKLKIENWIPEPRSGMDASSFDTRRVLLASADFRENVAWNGILQALAANCGDEQQDHVERYAIIVGDPFRGYKQAQIVVESKHAVVTISERYHWRLHDKGVRIPHHGIRNPHQRWEYSPPSMIVERTMPIEALNGIRNSWLDPALWDAPQKDSQCSRIDGAALLLESCVQGRYFVRYRNCAPEEHEPANQMQEEVKKLSEVMIARMQPLAIF